jgi:hypothetical protein
MLYSNSEQIFIDVLGRVPTEDQWKEIHALLGTATRAGFAIDDASNAMHVTMLAWGWAHGTGRADVLALLRGRLQDVNATLEDVRKEMGDAIKSLQVSLNAISERMSTQPATASAPQIDPKELAAALGPLLQIPAQVTQHYDVGDSVKDALHKAFKWTRMYIQDTRQIAALTAANVAQEQQLKDLQAQAAQAAGAARGYDHKRP